jgi:hypothetical protein
LAGSRRLEPQAPLAKLQEALKEKKPAPPRIARMQELKPYNLHGNGAYNQVTTIARWMGFDNQESKPLRRLMVSVALGKKR